MTDTEDGYESEDNICYKAEQNPEGYEFLEYRIEKEIAPLLRDEETERKVKTRQCVIMGIISFYLAVIAVSAHFLM